MNQLVTINSYQSRIEAEIAKGHLESEGIPAIISADDAGGMRPFPIAFSFGVELQVRESDEKKARKILGILSS